MSRIEDCLKLSGFNHFGFSPITPPMTLDSYESWLNRKLNGSMSYLQDHLPFKQDPHRLMPEVGSAIVVAKNYWPHPYPSEKTPSQLRIAKYAQGKDYHNEFQSELNELCLKLKDQFQEENFIAFSDSKPVLERDLAYRAGLGWFGKNSCIIDQKKGSLFLLGEIFTTLSLRAPEVLHPNRCGTCTRCIDACPTQAIIEDKVIDANKCISYLTIESKGIPPVDLRQKIGDWFFGCDICQDVCPWNQKVFNTDFKVPKSNNAVMAKELCFILETSNNQLMQHFNYLPLSRAGGRGLKRNAMIVAANLKLTEVIPKIMDFENHETLGELARWSIQQIQA